MRRLAPSPPRTAFVATATSAAFALSFRRRLRTTSNRRAVPRASMEEEIFARRAMERAQLQQPPIAPEPPTSPPLHSDGEFVVAPDANVDITPVLPSASATTSSGTPESGDVMRVIAPGVSRVVRSAKEGVVSLVQENSLTGNLRLPTGPEAVLIAWEAVMVVALIALLRAGVSRTLRWIHTRLSASRRDAVPYEQSVFECMQRPLESASIFTVATALAEAVSRPLAATGLLRYVRTLRELGLIVCATWFLLRWIDRIRARFAVDKRIDKTQVDATSRIATVATTIVSVLISLDTVGINVQTVLAFGGIGGVAIGFAGREIISNFFGGFMIYVTRPFTVGEWIRSIEEEELNGTVEDIGWYLTRVRTWDKRPLYIPNSRFSTLIVENGSRMANRRILHTLDLRHEDIPVLPKIVADLTKMLMAHSELDPRQHRMAYVERFAAYSAQIWLSCYTKSVFLYDFRRVQQEILLNAHEIIRANGARLATSITRDVRPGIDTDRYGPYGTHASFKSPSEEPKVRSTPAPQQFKISDIPGAPFFSSIHAEDALRNIESGIAEDALAAARRTDAPFPQPDPVPATDASVPTKAQQEQARSTREAAVVAAAAALAAARRNAARMEDRGTADGVTEQGVDTPARTGTGKMKITAVPKSRAGSETVSAAASSAATPSSVHDSSADAGAGVSGESSAYASGSGTNSATAGSSGITPSSGTMKITAVRKTKGSPPEKADDVGTSSESAEQSSGTSTASTGSGMSGSGMMKIVAVRKSNATSPNRMEAGSTSIDTGPRAPGSERADEGRGSNPASGSGSAMAMNPASNSNSTGGSGSGTMKISAVRKTKGSPPEKADDVTQRTPVSGNSAANGTSSNGTAESGGGSEKLRSVRKPKGAAPPSTGDDTTGGSLNEEEKGHKKG